MPPGGPPLVAPAISEIARRTPEWVAVVDSDGTKTTYGTLVGRAARAAHYLLEMGLAPGDRVAAWLDDGSSYVELYMACAMAGLVVVPLNARYTSHEVGGLLGDSAPRAIAWSAARDGAIDELAGDLPDIRLRIAPRGAGSAGPPAPAPYKARAWDSVVSTGSTRPLQPAHPGDLLTIGYTSGTTGTPKGALLTQASVAAVVSQHPSAYRLLPHSVIAMTGSMSFVSVVPAHVLTHLAVSGTVVFLGARWDVGSLLDTVERHGVTFTYLPTPVLEDFAGLAGRHPQRYSSLHSVLHSASKASAESLAALVDVLGDRLVEGWGMTENSGGLMTVTSPEDVLDPVLLGTVGRALPGYEVRVIDEELQVRGPGVVAGYWGRPDETAKSFRNGWFATGDTGTIDERGYVTILERRTDLIVSGGMNVYPAEVEAVVRDVPGVADVAVVGAPHPRWRQTVVAVVVPGAGASDDLADRVLARCRERLASYKKPTQVLLVAELPRTVSMKVSRAAVRAIVLERLAPSND